MASSAHRLQHRISLEACSRFFEDSRSLSSFPDCIRGVLYYVYGKDLPDPERVRHYHAFETTKIYARDGQTLLYELIDPHAGNRTVVPFDRVPRVLKDATIAVEDANFYQHSGVDPRGIIRALWLNLKSGRIVSGGSTITQQLARTLFFRSREDEQSLPLHQRYERKVREAILSFRMNQKYSKDEILGLYLNEVYYGARAYGVEAAAQTYFDKHVWELSDAEATLLAGLPQSPSILNPFKNMDGARARQHITLDLMVKNHYLSPRPSNDHPRRANHPHHPHDQDSRTSFCLLCA